MPTIETVDRQDLIRRGKAALFRYQNDPLLPSIAEVREHQDRLYVVLSDGKERVVYRVHFFNNQEGRGDVTLRVMKRPPREVIESV